MALWPPEYEELRAEARSMGEAIVTGLDDYGGEPPTDLHERIAHERKVMASFEVRSPAGRDEEIAGVDCRVFEPPAASRGTYLHFHGGAYAMGSPLLNDAMNEMTSKTLGVRVVSADYRLAPEHPFPAGTDDCLAVAESLLADATGPLLIGGESAGAYFSVTTLLRARDELGAAGRFAAANLLFGNYDLGRTPSARGARPTDLPDMIDPNMIEWVAEAYLLGTTYDVRDPAVSPLFAELHDLPPAIFSVGTADHFFDDSSFMAARWQAYGNESELAVYPDCGHAFNAFPMELARRANDRIHTFLDGALVAAG